MKKPTTHKEKFPTWLPVRAVSQVLKVNQARVYQLIHKGRLRTRTAHDPLAGKRMWLISRASVMAYQRWRRQWASLRRHAPHPRQWSAPPAKFRLTSFFKPVRRRSGR